MWVRTSSGKAKKGVAPLDSPNLGVLHVVESVDEEGEDENECRMEMGARVNGREGTAVEWRER